MVPIPPIMPTPNTAPTSVCVVETGMPKTVADITVKCRSKLS